MNKTLTFNNINKHTKLITRLNSALLILCLVALNAGCTQHHSLKSPENPSTKFYGTPGEEGDFFRHGEAPTHVYATDLDCTDYLDIGAPANYLADMPMNNYAGNFGKSLARQLTPANLMFESGLSLSPGDLVELYIEHGEGFNGKYVVDSQGRLNIPYLPPVDVRSQSLTMVTQQIELALIRNDIFQPANNLVTLRVLHWAEIEVTVSGAVFNPGRVRINARLPDQVLEQRVNAAGDHSSNRMLSEALRASSGIRPDAKLDQVILIREGWHVEVDLMGIFTGEKVNDIPLVYGDRVIVPSTGCFQQHLVRPSQITPKGFRVFMSNLIDSAGSNSNAAIGRFSSNIPYGSRLLHAVVSANCAGGKQLTNAPRKVVLASRNPITGETQVVERSIELLMRQAHLERINPYLMPNDAIACYDSDVTNIRDAAKSITDVLLPFEL
jgi:protein involved in polysaccharide export with SLBB domain